MADVQSSGNDSAGKRTESSAKTCSFLKPSSFTASNAADSGVESGSLPGNFGSNPFASTRLPTPGNEGSFSQQHANENPTPSKFVLRPSALDKHTLNFNESNFGTPVKSNSFKLEPPKLFSPFPVTALGRSSDVGDNGRPETTNHADGEKNEEKPAEQTDEAKNPCAESETQPDKSQEDSEDADKSENGTEKETGFVFGQNLEARVTAVPAKASTEAPASSVSGTFVFGSDLENRVVMPTREESAEPVLDESQAKADDSESPKDDQVTTTTTTTVSYSSSLSLDAAKLQAKSAENRVELKQVEVITGEENESNVFQFNAKLYVFDKASQNWVERGRGLLRLNDRIEEDANRPFHSRLVMRTQGSLRVILNTMIWSGMLVDRASAKSIQISAVDGEEGVKIFLINANPNDAEQIYGAITSRVQQLKALEVASGKQPTKESPTSVLIGRKRTMEPESLTEGSKRPKMEQEQRRELTGEESNDSSALYPETEASNEGFASSPTVQSSSSSCDA